MIDKERIYYKNLEIKNIKDSDWNCSLDNLMFNEKLYDSIKGYGQLKNIVVREISPNNYEIIDGRKILQILKRLGEKEVQCKIFPDISIEDSKLIYLQSKITYELDNIAIAQLLISIKGKIKDREIAKVTGLRIRDIKSYYELFDFAFDKYEEKLKKKPRSFF